MLRSHSIFRWLQSPWLMWLIAVSFVLFQFFLQLSAGVFIVYLMRDFNMTALGGGILVGSFYFIYVILQTPAGILVDRFGPRKLLSIGGCVCAFGCFLFAISHLFYMALIGRLFMGLGASSAFISSLYLVDEWFPASYFALMVGFTETIGMCGALTGNVYLAILLKHESWRSAMLFFAFISLILGGCCWLIIRDKSVDPIQKPKVLPNSNFWYDVKWILKHRGLWFNGLYGGLLFSVVTVFAGLWALPYIKLIQHVTLPMATFECNLVFIGIAVGGPFMGWLYPNINFKRLFLVFTGLFAFVLAVWLIYFTPQSVWIASILFFTLGFICSSYVFSYSIANQISPKTTRSTCIGFTNMLCVITAPVLQPLVGLFLHLAGRHNQQWSYEVYTLNNYHWALIVIPFGLFIAAWVALKLPKSVQLIE